MTEAERGEATALIDFWFGPPISPRRFQYQERWFTSDAQFDNEIRQRFLPLQMRAGAGFCAGWMREAEPCLALILLLDQLPRNLYRGSAQAFATDAMARAAAGQALSRGFDRSLPAVWRSFVYLPFEHSEDLADQERSVALFTALAQHLPDASMLDYAKRHREIIARFGRFPHRNHILGRSATAAEEAFLKEPNSSFG